jgi:hypothetical protein
MSIQFLIAGVIGVAVIGTLVAVLVYFLTRQSGGDQ